jgi:hypothetical protein
MIPVILIHKGYQDYLGCAINQALKNNPVHLIGDASPPIIHDSFKFSNLNEYCLECDEFRSHYEHLNTTPVEFEIFCYQRWFILKNFMLRNNLDKIFYIDSDVLLFANMTTEWEKFNQYEMTLLHRTAAISSFITLKGVTDFCNLLMSTYKDKNTYNYKKIASHYQVRKECGLAGGVCDMTHLEFFHYCSECGGGPGKVGEMMQIIDDSTYDHNINVPDQGFAFINGRKDFKIKGGIPYVYNERLGKEIKFNTIHFQGGAKQLIRSVYDQC